MDNDAYMIFKEISEEVDNTLRVLLYKECLKGIKEFKCKDNSEKLAYELIADALKDAIKYRGGEI